MTTTAELAAGIGKLALRVEDLLAAETEEGDRPLERVVIRSSLAAIAMAALLIEQEATAREVEDAEGEACVECGDPIGDCDDAHSHNLGLCHPECCPCGEVGF